MRPCLVCVFGGTGFLGRAVVAALLRAGARVRIVARTPRTLPLHGAAEAQEACAADIRDAQAVARALDGADAAVNAVSLYVEGRHAGFEDIHVAGAETLARCAARQRLRRLVHVSGIGAREDSPSAYVRARARGERAAVAAFGGTVVLRPSVLFGPGDAFLSTLDVLTRLPLIPLFGRGDMRLQPVHVDDLAEAAARLLANNAAAEPCYALGGASVLSYRDLIARVLAFRQRRRLLLPVPFAMWRMLAAMCAVLPNPPLTRDQLELMRHDNIADPSLPGFAALGLQPSAVEERLADSLDAA